MCPQETSAETANLCSPHCCLLCLPCILNQYVYISVLTLLYIIDTLCISFLIFFLRQCLTMQPSHMAVAIMLLLQFPQCQHYTCELCVYVCIGVLAHVCICGGQRLMLDNLLNCFSTLFLETRSLSLARLPAKSWGLPVSTPQHWGYRCVQPCSDFFKF